MKKLKLLLTGTAILAIVSASMATNQKFGGGTIYCFPSTQTVITNESCAGQPNGALVNFTLGTGSAVPCPANQVPYQNGSLSCTNESTQTFVATLP